MVLKNIDAVEKINTISIPIDNQELIKGLTIYVKRCCFTKF